tara:strand:+ start:47 stop:502 length:456 start_codon:yes stop_codon:yes gene_type:complete
MNNKNTKKNGYILIEIIIAISIVSICFEPLKDLTLKTKNMIQTIIIKNSTENETLYAINQIKKEIQKATEIYQITENSITVQQQSDTVTLSINQNNIRRKKNNHTLYLTKRNQAKSLIPTLLASNLLLITLTTQSSTQDIKIYCPKIKANN